MQKSESPTLCLNTCGKAKLKAYLQAAAGSCLVFCCSGILTSSICAVQMPQSAQAVLGCLFFHGILLRIHNIFTVVYVSIAYSVIQPISIFKLHYSK